jgi:hypothetical protein
MINELNAVASIVNAITDKKKDKNFTNDAEKSYALLKQMYTGPSSISRKAKRAIYEYPFLISSGVSNIDTIVKIMKHCEVEYSDMLLISMGLNPSANNQDNINIQKYLSDYHTNGTDYSMMNESVYDRKFQTKGINELITNEADTELSVISSKESEDNSKSEFKGTFDAKTIGEKYADYFNMTVIKVELRLNGDKNSSFTIPIGIRAIPHHLNSNDLLYIMESFIKSRVSSGIVRFIQWRSGEIKGMQNLLFRYDEIKNDIDYEKRIGTNNSWLSVLKARSNNRRFHILSDAYGNLTGKGMRTSDILPDCTFVINFADVDEIEDKTGVNLFTNTSAARKFLDDSMGLGLCIIDDGLNVAHIMFSGDTRFVAIPIANMGKQNSGPDFTKVFLDVMKRSI